MWRIWFVFALSCTTLPCFSQTEDFSAGELLENFFRENEQASESDVQLFLENLENRRLHPLDLNRADREDLSLLQLLNEIQIENFLEYRAKFGPLLNEYELQAVPSWDLTDIRRLLPFVQVSTGLEQRNIPLIQGFVQGQNELISRWGRTNPVPYNAADAEGEPDAWALRFRHSFDNRMRFGLTAESDPGEALFQKSNPQGFDFYSAHFFVQNVNPTLKTAALGDFSARFGQGLLLQTGFSPGKSAETTSIARSGRKLGAYGAFGEAYFLRGAATTLALGKNWEATALFSARRRDANVLNATDTIQEFPDLVFSSLQTSGLHRTASEVADEKSIREWLTGLSVTRNWRNGQVSLNGLHLEYDKPWQPSSAPYRQFVFTGKQLTGISLDYFWRRRNWYAFGEFARSDNGGTAAVNGLLFSADRHVTLAILHRALARDYQSVYASPFAETSSGASNEQGVYVGTDVRFGRKWQFNAYVDVWKHPWLRFEVSAPSVGSEYLGRLIWTPKRGVSFQALWFLETKERDSNTEGISVLRDNRRGRFRLHASYKLSSALEMRSRVEWTTFQVAPLGKTRGFLAFQEAVVRPLGFPVYGSVRYAIFDTEDYDTRVYTFENDLFSAISIPAFSGRGARYFINVTWRVNKWLRLEGRMEQTMQRFAVTDSGKVGRKTAVKVQMRVQW